MVPYLCVLLREGARVLNKQVAMVFLIDVKGATRVATIVKRMFKWSGRGEFKFAKYSNIMSAIGTFRI